MRKRLARGISMVFSFLVEYPIYNNIIQKIFEFVKKLAETLVFRPFQREFRKFSLVFQ
jgi:hypothetical protein